MARYYQQGLDNNITRQLAANDKIETQKDKDWISCMKQMEEFQNRNKNIYEPQTNKENNNNFK